VKSKFVTFSLFSHSVIGLSRIWWGCGCRGQGVGSSRGGVNVNANKLYDSLQIEIQRRQLKRI